MGGRWGGGAEPPGVGSAVVTIFSSSLSTSLPALLEHAAGVRLLGLQAITPGGPHVVAQGVGGQRPAPLAQPLLGVSAAHVGLERPEQGRAQPGGVEAVEAADDAGTPRFFLRSPTASKMP